MHFENVTTSCADTIDLNALKTIGFSCTLACELLSLGTVEFVMANFLSL